MLPDWSSVVRCFAFHDAPRRHFCNSLLLVAAVLMDSECAGVPDERRLQGVLRQARRAVRARRLRANGRRVGAHACMFLPVALVCSRLIRSLARVRARMGGGLRVAACVAGLRAPCPLAFVIAADQLFCVVRPCRSDYKEQFSLARRLEKQLWPSKKL